MDFEGVGGKYAAVRETSFIKTFAIPEQTDVKQYVLFTIRPT